MSTDDQSGKPPGRSPGESKDSGVWPFSTEQEELLRSVWGPAFLEKIKGRTQSLDSSRPDARPSLGSSEKTPESSATGGAHAGGAGAGTSISNADPKAEAAPATPSVSRDDLVGQRAAKAALDQVIALAKVAQERKARGLPATPVTLHAAFTGSPGTGKTTFARFYAQEVRKLGVLKQGQMVEVSRQDLVAEYQGQTASKTTGVVSKARGGVLFIDEAYSIKRAKEDAYGQECIDTLIKLMEDWRDELIVILAGYTNEMREFLHLNPGMKSRVPNVIEFEDFTDEELGLILDRQLKKSGLVFPPKGREYAIEQIARQRRGKSFGNGREVRNFFERAVAQQAARLAKQDLSKLPQEALCLLTFEDLTPDLEEGDAAPTGASASERLDALVGLANVKKEVRSILDYIRVARLRNATTGQGAASARVNLGFALQGLPGVGKKTVARLLGELLSEAGLLAGGHTVVVDRSGLVGGYQGQTALKTRERVEEALGGVLLLDGIAALLPAPGRDDAYAQEALTTLAAALSENQGKLAFVVCEESAVWERAKASIPALGGLCGNSILFPEPQTGELAAIAELLAKQDGFTLEPQALELLKRRLEVERKLPGFAYARAVRLGLDAAYRRQASRLLGAGDPQRLPPEALHQLLAADWGE